MCPCKDERVVCVQGAALAFGEFGENEGGGTHERGTSMPLDSRSGILLVVFSPAFTESGLSVAEFTAASGRL